MRIVRLLRGVALWVGALLGLSLLDEPQRTRVRVEKLDPDQADDEAVEARLDDHAPAEPASALDELDIALAAFGVGIAHIDEPHSRDRPGKWEVVWPDDDDDEVDLMGRSHGEEREIVLTG